MRGTILTFRPNEHDPIITAVESPPTLEMLKAAIGGGYLEAVPRFTTIRYNGLEHHCVAFCDEEGKLKDLPFNFAATALWERTMRQNFGCSCAPDFLVGQVAVVFGDREWMEAL